MERDPLKMRNENVTNFFWENTASQEQINEAEATLQLSAAELLTEEKQNLWTGAGLSRNWKIFNQNSKRNHRELHLTSSWTL